MGHEPESLGRHEAMGGDSCKRRGAFRGDEGDVGGRKLTGVGFAGFVAVNREYV